jgi:uncharacterized protein YdbL (DUF1318 family)
MLKAIGFVLKCTLFAVAVLVAGNWIRWDGRTASDRVTHWIHQAQRSPSLTRGAGEVAEKVGGTLQGWTQGLTADARAGAAKARISGDRATSTQAGAVRADQVSAESISPSERQKLRALIRELNSSHHRE